MSEANRRKLTFQGQQLKLRGSKLPFLKDGAHVHEPKLYLHFSNINVL